MNRCGSILVVVLALAAWARAAEPAKATKALPEEKLKALADRFFQPLIDRQWAHALVIGVIDERGQHVFGLGGVSDDNSNLPDADTVFEIGSVTKTFTGTLLADMAERGEVSVDDPVNKFLPDDIQPLKCGGREMRLVDLATHTSGLPRMPTNWSPHDMADPYADYTTEKMFDFLREYAQPSLTKSLGTSIGNLFGGKPKQTMAYSNLGVGLLGTLLARQAKQPYEELLLERICRPLGMTSTRLVPDESMTARLIEGHDADGNKVNNWKFDCLAPCGGIRSTAGDMLKYVAANMELVDTPLKAAMDKAQQTHFTVNPNLNMGLNWLLRKPDIVFHNGMTGGYCSFVAFSKSKKLGVVILANSTIGGESVLLDRVAVPFLRTLTEEKPHEPPTIRAAVPVERQQLEKYAGKYTLVPLVATVTVTCEDDGLHAQLTGQQKFRLYPESSTKFFYKVVDAQITFETDDAGAVQRLILHQNGKDMPAARQP